MRIAALRTSRLHVNARGDWVIVRVETADGLVGLGEASHGGGAPERDRLVAEIVERQIAPLLVGQDPRQPRALAARLAAVASGAMGWTAVSGVEQALWDLAGQAAGLSVARLLGGPVRATVPVYANINRSIVDRSPAGFSAAAVAAVAQGFTAVKCAPFDGVSRENCRTRDGQALAEAGLERVAAVRTALGTHRDLLVDCHQRFDVPTAIAVGRRLAALGVRWFEEPVATDDLDGLMRVRDRVDCEVIGGEHLAGLAGFWPYLQASVFGTIMPDVKHCGGIAALLAIGEVAAARGVAVAPHNPSGPVAMAATVQVAACLPTLRCVEYAFGEVDWRASLLTPAETISDGVMAVAYQPGLGVRLNEGVAALHAVAADT